MRSADNKSSINIRKNSHICGIFVVIVTNLCTKWWKTLFSKCVNLYLKSTMKKPASLRCRLRSSSDLFLFIKKNLDGWSCVVNMYCTCRILQCELYFLYTFYKMPIAKTLKLVFSEKELITMFLFGKKSGVICQTVIESR